MVVKCTHKSGTFSRVIWQTGARRLPEKSFRLFIRVRKCLVEKGSYGSNIRLEEENEGLLLAVDLFLNSEVAKF